MKILKRRPDAIAVMLVIIAAAMRVYGVRFGLPALLDPDELIFIGGTYQMAASGTLNPGWFGHPGTTTMYVLGVIGGLVLGIDMALGNFESASAFADALYLDPGMIVLPARVVMGLFGAANVALCYVLAKRISGRLAGYIAAAVLAFNPVHIFWSQVIRTDVMAITFMLLCAHFALNFAESGRKRDLVWACFFTALALTTKWPFALSFIAPAAAIWTRTAREASWADEYMLFIKRCLCSAGLVIFFVFAISPHIFLDYQTVLSNLQGESKTHHLGATSDGDWDNLVYYISGPIWRGMGPAALLFAAIGLYVSRRLEAFWITIGAITVVLIMIMLKQPVHFERWAVPFFPALAIASGIGFSALMRRIALPKTPHKIIMGLVIFAILAPLFRETLISQNERLHDTRRQATDWARQNLPPKSRIMVEHFAFDLASTSFGVLFPIGTGGCLDARALLAGKVNYKQIDAMRGGNSNLDFAAIPPEKIAGCKADFAILTEHGRYQDDKANFPEGNARYQALIARGRIAARFTAVPGETGGRREVLVVDLR